MASTVPRSPPASMVVRRSTRIRISMSLACGNAARIVRGIDHLDKVSSDDVLVIPFSDVGWTPLFAQAGAVVTESGGMLSHSSIVAREYGLPCVVSVKGAMRIPDGATITVDGCRGTITLEDQS